jgi:hypothetical protein
MNSKNLFSSKKGKSSVKKAPESFNKSLEKENIEKDLKSTNSSDSQVPITKVTTTKINSSQQKNKETEIPVNKQTNDNINYFTMDGSKKKPLPHNLIASLYNSPNSSTSNIFYNINNNITAIPLILPISKENAYFQIQDTQGNGNCFLEALSLYLLGDEKKSDLIKDVLYQYIMKDYELFADIYAEENGDIIYDKSFKEFVKDFKNHSWGGSLDMLLISRIFQTKIKVLRIDNKIFNSLLMENINDIDDDQLYRILFDSLRVDQGFYYSKDNNKCCYLLFCNFMLKFVTLNNCGYSLNNNHFFILQTKIPNECIVNYDYDDISKKQLDFLSKINPLNFQNSEELESQIKLYLCKPVTNNNVALHNNINNINKGLTTNSNKTNSVALKINSILKADLFSLVKGLMHIKKFSVFDDIGEDSNVCKLAKGGFYKQHDTLYGKQVVTINSDQYLLYPIKPNKDHTIYDEEKKVEFKIAEDVKITVKCQKFDNRSKQHIPMNKSMKTLFFYIHFGLHVKNFIEYYSKGINLTTFRFQAIRYAEIHELFSKNNLLRPTLSTEYDIFKNCCDICSQKYVNESLFKDFMQGLKDDSKKTKQ